jgi:hypothetical protein
MLFGRHKTAVAGSLLLPRSRAGQINWPRCARCRRIVDAYGIENETDGHIEIWARCDGLLMDPATGLAMPFVPRVHPPMKGSVVILKGAGWSPNRLTDIASRQAFFAPDGGDRQWRQDLTPDGVGRRWGAG